MTPNPLIAELDRWADPSFSPPANAWGPDLRALLKKASVEIEQQAKIITSLRQDIACRDGGLSSLYAIREALGFNKFYPLSHLDDDARQMRTALLACAPLAKASIDAVPEETLGYIGGADTADPTPVSVTIETTLGAVREARRALWVVGV